jgi:hypothetical protein
MYCLHLQGQRVSQKSNKKTESSACLAYSSTRLYDATSQMSTLQSTVRQPHISNETDLLRFEVIAVVNMKITVFSELIHGT